MPLTDPCRHGHLSGGGSIRHGPEHRSPYYPHLKEDETMANVTVYTNIG